MPVDQGLVVQAVHGRTEERGDPGRLGPELGPVVQLMHERDSTDPGPRAPAPALRNACVLARAPNPRTWAAAPGYRAPVSSGGD